MSLLSKFLRRGGWLSGLVGLLVMAAAPAQASTVTVLQRNGDFTILTTGEVLVVETWEVQFQGGPFHFAYRYIPLHHVENITGWAVREGEQVYAQTSSGAANTFSVASEGGQQKITWYFPTTTAQMRVFSLSYTLHGALRLEDHGDEFYWKFIEAGRDYEIQAAHAVVHLPATFAPEQLQAHSYQNTFEDGGAYVLDGATVMFNSGPLGPGAEWEIRAGFPHGTILAAPPQWQQEPQEIQEPQVQPATTAPQANSDFNFMTIVCSPVGLAVLLIVLLLGLKDARRGGDGGGDAGGSGDGGGGGGDGGGDSGFG